MLNEAVLFYTSTTLNDETHTHTHKNKQPGSYQRSVGPSVGWVGVCCTYIYILKLYTLHAIRPALQTPSVCGRMDGWMDGWTDGREDGREEEPLQHDDVLDLHGYAMHVWMLMVYKTGAKQSRLLLLLLLLPYTSSSVCDRHISRTQLYYVNTYVASPVQSHSHGHWPFACVFSLVPLPIISYSNDD